MVTISDDSEWAKIHEERDKMVTYFVQTQKETWGDQFRIFAELGPMITDDNMILDEVTLYEALVHFTCIGWKFAFAFIPPASWCGGWACFVVALFFIGVVTVIVAEAATILGCVAGMPGSVTAITLVALGTSLPDTFASMTAARTSEFADSAIGNVTGSNCVNVFLGLGLPWVISARYNVRVLN